MINDNFNDNKQAPASWRHGRLRHAGIGKASVGGILTGSSRGLAGGGALGAGWGCDAASPPAVCAIARVWGFVGAGSVGLGLCVV